MRIASFAVMLALGSGCSIYFGDDEPPVADDEPPIDEECDTPNPGCRRDDCGPWCGDDVYGCVDGEWELLYQCDTCLGGVQAYPAYWTLLQVPSSPAGCVFELRTGVDLLAQPPQVPDSYADVSAQDPALTITWTTIGLPVGGYSGCATHVEVSFADTAVVDGEPVPVTGTWRLDLQDTREITGTLLGQVGLCSLQGTVSGGWEYLELDR